MTKLYEHPYRVFYSVEEMVNEYFKKEIGATDADLEKFLFTHYFGEAMADLRRLSNAKSLDRFLVVVFPAPDLTSKEGFAGLKIELESPDFFTASDVRTKPLRSGYCAQFQVIIDVKDESKMKIKVFNYLGQICKRMFLADIDSIIMRSADTYIEDVGMK